MAAAASYLEVPLGIVQAAVAYYGTYRREIDDWTDTHAADAEEAHAAWLVGAAAVQD